MAHTPSANSIILAIATPTPIPAFAPIERVCDVEAAFLACTRGADGGVNFRKSLEAQATAIVDAKAVNGDVYGVVWPDMTTSAPVDIIAKQLPVSCR